MNSPQPTTSARTTGDSETSTVLATCKQPDSSDYYAILWRQGWFTISGGIIFAAFAFPIVVGGITYAIGLLVVLLSALSGQTPLDSELIFGFLMSLVITPFSLGTAGLAGAILAAFVTVVITTVTHAVLESLGLKPRPVWLGAFTGGLVGFFSLVVLEFLLGWHLSLGVDTIVPSLVCRACVTTVFGQVGGAWGGIRINWYSRALAAAHAMVDGEPRTLADESGIISKAEAPRRLQFNIRQLLWISFWLSVLLMLVRISGIPYRIALSLLIGWLCFQTLTLWLGGNLAHLLGPWWTRRRQGRST